MGFAAIKERAHALFDEAGFIGHIANEDDYTQALALMDELVEDYEAGLRSCEQFRRQARNLASGGSVGKPCGTGGRILVGRVTRQGAR